MTEHEKILHEVESFLALHQMAPTTFGNLACADLHTVRRLRQGLGLTLKRVEQLRKFMREYKPQPQRRRGRPKSRLLSGAAA